MRPERDWRTFTDPEKFRALRGCVQKVKFPSKRAADGKVRVVRRNTPGPRAEALNSYKCRLCGGWHIGHSSRAKR